MIHAHDETTARAEAQKLLQRAETALSEDRRADAISALAAATRLVPHDEEPSLLAAMIHFQDSAPVEAAAAALDTLALRPYHPAALNLLGVVCLDAGYRIESKQLLTRASAFAPGFKGSRRNLLQARRGRPGTVIKGFPIERVREYVERDASGFTVCVAAIEGDAGLESTLESLPQGSPLVVVHGVANRAALLNQAISRAATDWVLVVHPGERLTASSTNAIHRAMRQGRTLYHELRIETGAAAHLEPRLFRNAPGVRYIGTVFPDLRPALGVLSRSWRLRAGRPTLTLRALPRAATVDDATCERWIAASGQELEECPGNPYILVHHARVLLETGDAETALQALELLKNGATTLLKTEDVTVLRARCLLRRERFAELVELIEHYHRSNRPTQNTQFLLGAALGHCGNTTAAARAFARCSEQSTELSNVELLAEISTAGLPNLHGAALMDSGRLDAAAAAFTRALEREPESLEAQMGHLSLMMARGEIEPLMYGLDDWIERRGEDPRVWCYGSILLGRIPGLATVHAQWTTEARRRFPQNRSLLRRHIEAQLCCGQADEALEQLRDWPMESVADLAAHCAAALAAGSEVPVVSAEQRDAVEDQVQRWLMLWMAQKMLAPVDRALTQLGSARTTLPNLSGRVATWLDEIGQPEAAVRLREAV